MAKIKNRYGKILFSAISIVAFVTSPVDGILAEEGGVFDYVIFPAYDYRPGFDHTLLLLQRFVWNLEDDQVVSSDVQLIKSLSNESWMIGSTNFYNTNDWRFELNGSLAFGINEISSNDLGLNDAANAVHAQFFGTPSDYDLGNVDTESRISVVQGFVKRRMVGDLYLGLGLEYQLLDFFMETGELDWPGPLASLPLDPFEDIEAQNTLLMPIIRLELDTRDSFFYPTTGFFATGSVFLITDSFGTTLEGLNAETGGVTELADYVITRNIVDVRYFYAPTGSWRTVVAPRLNVNTHTVLSGDDDVPEALFLNANGRIRGYEDGDYSGAQLYAVELELRQYVTDRLGFVAFGTLGFLGDDIEDSFTESENFVPGFGGGLRFLASERNRLALRGDIAFGKEGNWALYFGIAEYY